MAGTAGYMATTLQIALMQESLAVNRSNELSIAVLLGLWLLITGIGSLAGIRLRRIGSLAGWLPVILALLEPLTLALFRSLPAIIRDIPGEMSGLREFSITALAAIIPFCLLNGVLFTIPVRLALEAGSRSPGSVYMAESIGALCGAILTFLIHPACSGTIELIGYNLLIVWPFLFIVWMKRVHPAHLIRVIACLTLISVAAVAVTMIWNHAGIARALDSRFWPGQRILSVFDSVYGRWHLIEYQDELSLFNNGSLVTHGGISRPDEETFTYALMLHPEPKSILSLDGAWSSLHSITDQIPATKVTVISLDMSPLHRLDPGQILMLTEATARNSQDILQMDPRIAMASSGDASWDVIISNASDPLSLTASRYYSAEFFREIRRKLGTNGVFALSLTGSENMMSPELTRYVALIIRTLRTAFKPEELVVIPGDPIHVFARRGSAEPVPADILIRRVREAGIVTQYPLDTYLPFRMNPQTIHAFYDAIDHDPSEDITTDLRPLVFPTCLDLWHSQWRPSLRSPFRALANLTVPICIGIPAVAAIANRLTNRRRNRVFMAVGLTGAASMIAQIALMFLLQLETGALYQKAGLLVGLYAFGLAAGSMITEQIKPDPRKWIGRVQGVLGLLLLGLCLSIQRYGGIPECTIFLASFACAMFSGSQFVLASREYPDLTPSLYMIDLAGASVSSLILSIFFLPVAGIPITGSVLGFTIVVSAIFLLRSSDRHA